MPWVSSKRNEKKKRKNKKKELFSVYIFTAEYKNRMYENLFLIFLFHHHKCDDITFLLTSISAALYKWNKELWESVAKERIFSIHRDDSKSNEQRKFTSIVVFIIGSVCAHLNYPEGFSSQFNFAIYKSLHTYQ